LVVALEELWSLSCDWTSGTVDSNGSTSLHNDGEKKCCATLFLVCRSPDGQPTEYCEPVLKLLNDIAQVMLIILSPVLVLSRMASTGGRAVHLSSRTDLQRENRD